MKKGRKEMRKGREGKKDKKKTGNERKESCGRLFEQVLLVKSVGRHTKNQNPSDMFVWVC